MENQTKAFNDLTLKIVKNRCELTGFDYNPPFIEEIKIIGGRFDSTKFLYFFDDLTQKTYDKIVEVCNYYFTPQKHYTSGQRSLVKKISTIFGECSGDFIFRKDDEGLSFVDLNQACGVPNQIATVLRNNKVKVVKTTERRIYISN